MENRRGRMLARQLREDGDELINDKEGESSKARERSMKQQLSAQSR